MYKYTMRTADDPKQPTPLSDEELDWMRIALHDPPAQIMTVDRGQRLLATIDAANATISRLQEVVSAAKRYKVAVQDPRQDKATFMEWSSAQVGLIAALDRLEADDD